MVYFFVVCLGGMVNIWGFDGLGRFIIFGSLVMGLFIIMVGENLCHFFDVIGRTVSLLGLLGVAAVITIKSGFIFAYFDVLGEWRMSCWTHSFIYLLLSFQAFLQ
jgi:hypothetical protein